MLEIQEQNQQIDDNEPDQIQRPAQYPTATRISNGTAYDISGKALGPVGDQGTSQAAQPKDDSFFTSLGGQIVQPQLEQQVKDDSFFQKLGGKIVQAPQAPQAVRPGETPGAGDITGIRARETGHVSGGTDMFGREIEASPAGARKQWANWFDDMKGDLENGTDATWVGWLLRKAGAKGTAYGVAPGLGENLPVINIPSGLAKAGHALVTAQDHPVQAANEMISATGQVLSPLMLTQPEALPFMARAGVTSKAVSYAAKQMGADDETAELIGNVAGVATGGKAVSKTHIDASFERSLTASIKPRTVIAPAKLTFLQRLWRRFSN